MRILPPEHHFSGPMNAAVRRLDKHPRFIPAHRLFTLGHVRGAQVTEVPGNPFVIWPEVVTQVERYGGLAYDRMSDLHVREQFHLEWRPIGTKEALRAWVAGLQAEDFFESPGFMFSTYT